MYIENCQFFKKSLFFIFNIANSPKLKYNMFEISFWKIKKENDDEKILDI